MNASLETLLRTLGAPDDRLAVVVRDALAARVPAARQKLSELLPSLLDDTAHVCGMLVDAGLRQLENDAGGAASVLTKVFARQDLTAPQRAMGTLLRALHMKRAGNLPECVSLVRNACVIAADLKGSEVAALTQLIALELELQAQLGLLTTWVDPRALGKAEVRDALGAAARFQPLRGFAGRVEALALLRRGKDGAALRAMRRLISSLDGGDSVVEAGAARLLAAHAFGDREPPLARGWLEEVTRQGVAFLDEAGRSTAVALGFAAHARVANPAAGQNRFSVDQLAQLGKKLAAATNVDSLCLAFTEFMASSPLCAAALFVRDGELLATMEHREGAVDAARSRAMSALSASAAPAPMVVGLGGGEELQLTFFPLKHADRSFGTLAWATTAKLSEEAHALHASAAALFAMSCWNVHSIAETEMLRAGFEARVESATAQLNASTAKLREAFASLEESKQRIEEAQRRMVVSEFSVARELQLRMLPPPEATRAGPASIIGVVSATEHCGGDLWSYRVLPDRLLIFIGDVTGHGMRAAILMATMKAALEMFWDSDVLATPTAVLAQLNHVVRLNTDGRVGATAMVLEYRFQEGKLVVASAAHPPLFLVGDSGADIIGGPGDGLGADAEPSFFETVLDVAPSTKLLLVTDGVLEHGLTKGSRGYGGKRLLRTLDRLNASVASPEDAMAELQRDHAAYLSSRPEDDVTWVLVDLDAERVTRSPRSLGAPSSPPEVAARSS